MDRSLSDPEARREAQPAQMPFGWPQPGAFFPIAEYAFLSDREAMALVSPSGDVEWLCIPRPDGPSVFGAILDRAAGSFRVGPDELSVPAGRRYLPGTNVLETTWQTRSGWLIVRSALAVRRWSDEQRQEEYVRPPDDYRADHVLVRTIKCINGQVDLEVRCEPVFGYGLRDADWAYAGPGYGEAVATGDPEDAPLRLTTDLRLGLEGRTARAHTTMQEGDRAFVALSWGDGRPPADVAEAEECLRLTGDFWRGWVVGGNFPDHPWRPVLQRSALTLKGLTYAPTGALLAAPTTSLPEITGGERNWDYRYTWVRDATWALWGLYTLGFANEARDFFHFIADRIGEDAPLQVLYGVGGERELTERTLDHLSGYENSRPVRIGNDAYRQQQNDVWGALLDSVLLNLGAGEHLTGVTWAELVRIADQAASRWREPDQGVWEVRSAPDHFTSSKIMCWVACDRAARLAEAMDEPGMAVRWRTEADTIRADVLAHGVDERGVLTQRYGSNALDASSLLAVLMGFLPPDHPVARATVLAVADELSVNDLVLRYRADRSDDGLEGEEATFAICSFWLVSALVEIGEIDRARRLCEKLLSLASPLGLYAEELDATSGRHLGNFPQAFTHLALINALMHVIHAEAAHREAGAEPDLATGSVGDLAAAGHAVGGPGDGLQTLGGDLRTTSDAHPVGPVVDPAEGGLDGLERPGERPRRRRLVDALDRLRRSVAHALTERNRRGGVPADLDEHPER
jgi:GH15 family glucan-1,4-alpha-glucosidase